MAHSNPTTPTVPQPANHKLTKALDIAFITNLAFATAFMQITRTEFGATLSTRDVDSLIAAMLANGYLMREVNKLDCIIKEDLSNEF